MKKKINILFKNQIKKPFEKNGIFQGQNRNDTFYFCILRNISSISSSLPFIRSRARFLLNIPQNLLHNNGNNVNMESNIMFNNKPFNNNT